MRDLFDDFLEELRRREALARGEDPGPKRSPSGEPSRDDGDDEPEPADPDARSTEAGDDTAADADERDADAPEPDAEADTEPPPPLPFDPRRRRGRRGRGGRPPGGPNDGAGGGGSRGRRFGIAVFLIALLAVFLLFSFGIDLWTDALWFTSVGFDAVFWTRLTATLGLFAGTFLLASVVLLLNLWIASRLTPPPAEEGAVSLRSLIGRVNDAAQAADSRRDRSSPFYMSGDRNSQAPVLTFDAGDIPDLTPLAGGILVAIALFIALVIAGSVSSAWETVLLWINRVPFSPTASVTDPIFNRDIGFFLFELPFLRLAQGLFNAIVVTSLLIALGRYLVGATRGGLVFSTPIRVHLAVLGALFLLSVAFGYQLDKLELSYSMRGVAAGVSYTDQNAQFLAFDVLTVVSGLAAAFLVGGAFTRMIWPLGLTIAVWFVASLVVGRIYPEAVQRFSVTPNQYAQEERYIGNNIAMTQLAFDVGTWTDDVPFNGTAVLTPEQVASEAPTFASARLWDPRPLQASLDQLQTVRKYYDFTDVDTDRYSIGGVQRQVMLSARELALELNPRATGWVNQRIVYTHGIGVAMVPVNEAGSQGQPNLLIGNLPPVSTGGAPPITQPRIYFGERDSSYVVTGAQEDEFDYPTGETDPLGSAGAQTRWTGTTGIKLDNTLMRLLFAARFRDLDLLISEQVTSASQLLFHRSLSDRLTRVAPFLRFDKDPYIVVNGAGHLVYMQDAFTTSDRFPDAQPFDLNDLAGTNLGSDQINYIRNSVKITVDAYDGTMHFYVADPDDPIIRAYQGIFPTMFEPLSAMPADLRAHIRVPEELFNIQTLVFGRYHVTDTLQFFRGDDLWTVPAGSSNDQRLPSQAYYVEMHLPGQTGVEFLLLQPMVPTSRPNMIAWVAARNDGDNYGSTLVYRFPADTTVFGPAQIEARIDQDPVISAQISLWNQSGSKVIYGNLIVLPLDDALIYLQPVYLQSTGSAFPAFTRIVVASPRQVVWSNSLGDALRLLLAAEAGAPPGPTPQPSPGPTPTPGPGASATPSPSQPTGLPADVPGLIDYANRHFELAQAALRDSDFARYGEEIKLVQAALQRLQELAPELAQPSPGAASASPAP